MQIPYYNRINSKIRAIIFSFFLHNLISVTNVTKIYIHFTMTYCNNYDDTKKESYIRLQVLH